jgi:uncharacterized membrane protein
MRTADDTAGKHAKCPACGSTFTIPAAGTSSAGVGVPPSQPPAGPPPGAPAPGVGANPYQSPGVYPTAAAPVQPAGAVQSTRIDIGDVLSTTWEIFKVEWGTCLLAGIIASLTIGGTLALLIFLPMFFMVLGGKAVFLGIVLSFFGFLAWMLFVAWMLCGAMRFFIMVARGDRPELGELFRGGPQFITVLLTNLLLSIGAGVLLGVCVLPGAIMFLISKGLGGFLMFAGLFVGYVVVIVAGIMFSQAIFLIIDRNAGVIESLQLSRQITAGNKLMLFLTWLVVSIVSSIISSLTCGLGSLATAPFMWLLAPVIYLRMSGQNVAGGK